MLVHALFYEIQNIFHELSVFLGSYARSFFPSSFFLLSSNLVAFSSSPGYYPPPTHPPLQFGAIVDAVAFGDALRRASSCHHPPSVRLKTLKRVLGIRKHNSQRLMQCPVHWCQSGFQPRGRVGMDVLNSSSLTNFFPHLNVQTSYLYLISLSKPPDLVQ